MFILHLKTKKRGLKGIGGYGGTTSIRILSPLLSAKIVHLVDKSDFFKISNLVYDGREIGRSLCSNLQGQRVSWWVY